MEKFITQRPKHVSGLLSGWDRIVFRGTYRSLCYVAGMMQYLWTMSVLLKDFSTHVEAVTHRLVQASLEAASRYERPIVYLPSSATRKEDVAREILRKNPVESGLICILKCVEPCQSYDIFRNRETKKLDLISKPRHCLHLYHYFLDPIFGFMNARLQTWFPFMIQICMNGREWLGRRMDQEGLSYDRYDNCFPWIEDFARAQMLMDEMQILNWPQTLDAIAAQVNPAASALFAEFPVNYYWSAHQTEWATDVAFHSPKDLAALYPQLVRGAMSGFSSPDVMRFLGRRYNGMFSGEVMSSFRDRCEGIRVKHSVNGNSVKMYDKGPNILRVETTINHAEDLKVFRTTENHPEQPKQWRPMRKGVADLHRRSEISQQTNERYLDALAHLDSTTRLEDLLGPASKPCKRKGKRVRALHFWTAEDQALLEFINRPEYLLGGFRNRDVAGHLFPEKQKTPQEQRRASAKTSYRLGVLRAHGIIQKLPGTRKYRTTPKGREIATAALISHQATIAQLTGVAA
jgi:hypothetical protein